jgi:crossover junction endodeoxyribonuclease RusA
MTVPMSANEPISLFAPPVKSRTTVILRLPLPPSANRLWVRAQKGMRRSDEYVAWLNEAGWTAKTQRPSKIDGPFKVSIHAARPDKRRRDIDNLIKPSLDLMEHLRIIEDDSDCERYRPGRRGRGSRPARASRSSLNKLEAFRVAPSSARFTGSSLRRAG